MSVHIVFGEVLVGTAALAELDLGTRAKIAGAVTQLARAEHHIRCQPGKAKRRLVVPGSREAILETRRAVGAKGDPKIASERDVQSFGS
ncbi:MAG: hypothetical protein ABW068_14040 [Candidatus Thiodiazotropha sp.]